MKIKHSIFFVLSLSMLAAVVGGVYYHLTKEIETYGITEAHSRPLAEKVPEGLADMKASTCGSCHQEIYAEWKTTVHSNAWVDDYFQTDWAYDKKKQNCLNCHTPLENQQPQLVTGFVDEDYWKPILKPNPNFDESFQQEGVTCAACHVRDGKIVGPHGIDDAPHPTTYEPNMRKGMDVCLRCHVTSATEEFSVGDPNICSTMNEIEANNIQPDCIECHMPKVTRPLVKGYPARPGRHHYWRGGHDKAMVSKDLKIDILKVAQKARKYDYRIDLTNIGTHHKLPTGTPDRHLVITIDLLDENNQVLKTKTHKIIRRILWRPIVVQLSDNRLGFNQPQSVDFSFNVDDKATALSLRVTAEYHFLEQWRRDQLNLPSDSHPSFTMVEKFMKVR